MESFDYSMDTTLVDRPHYRIVLDELERPRVRVHDRPVWCVFDMESPTSFIRSDQLQDICDSMQPEEREKAYDSFIRKRINLDVEVNGEVFPVDFGIIFPNKCTQKVVFGRDVLDRVNAFVRKNEVQIMSTGSKVVVKRSIVGYLMLWFIMAMQFCAEVVIKVCRCIWTRLILKNTDYYDYALRYQADIASECLDKESIHSSEVNDKEEVTLFNEADQSENQLGRWYMYAHETFFFKTCIIWLIFSTFYDVFLDGSLVQKLFLFC